MLQFDDASLARLIRAVRAVPYQLGVRAVPYQLGESSQPIETKWADLAPVGKIAA